MSACPAVSPDAAPAHPARGLTDLSGAQDPHRQEVGDPSAWKARLRTIVRGEAGEDLGCLRLLVRGLRPSEAASAGENLRALCVALERDAEARAVLGAVARRLVHDLRLHPGLADSGIDSGEGVVTETLARLGRRLVPPAPDLGDVRDAIRFIFEDRDDHLWVSAIPPAAWGRMLGLLGLHAPQAPTMTEEVAASLRVLAYHAASLGLQPEMSERLQAAVETNPFLRLGDTVLRYLDSFQNDVIGDEAPRLRDALSEVEQAQRAMEAVRVEKRWRGTSLWLTSTTSRLVAILHRLELLLHLGEPVEREVHDSVLRLLQSMVRAELTRDDIGPYLRASADLLVLQIVEHAARKGSKYIATGRADYHRFLLSSMGGGLLVALFAWFKVGMGSWSLPLGVQAILYGINYSVCFVLIYLTGATLATKQPAMTANTLARSLGRRGHDLGSMEEIIVRTWRSQFISFVGNLSTALPLAFVISMIFLPLAGTAVVSEEGAAAMLEALHPWRSGTVAYAAIAGILLFAAGLVSGWVDNWVVHRRVRHRLEGDGRLRRWLGEARLSRIAQGIDERLGVILGNVFLGFGLGSLGTVGEILGLPLDIRHIAFASAEVGIALQILGTDVPTQMLALVALAVALIGLLNFLVSFGLSLAVALESRRVGFGGSRRLFTRLGRSLWERPLSWFYPPRRQPTDGTSPRRPARGRLAPPGG